ncbi:hypothetical protein F7725_017707 [Dissostichus mawsoni]|uniref:Uncharacterized protein n=1 Tax=Dissostichus mawsoni TaxID=36200 RepID=A0A7J5XPP3_DISMA|nr:hypothetical protein F7725_017707 [Dissostichus mawsoni]
MVFVMAQEAELLYRTVPWEESLLQSAGKQAAGPLFDVKSSDEAAVVQLHLPHSETEDALLLDGLLSVVHITDEGLSILEPLEVTPTHVVVNVVHLSLLGIIIDPFKRLLKWRINGQILVFLRPPGREEQILDVHLLPNNVLVEEVAEKHRGVVNITLSSDCELDIDHSYSVHCEPEGFLTHPESKTFVSRFGPNYHPTFQVFLTTSTERVVLKVKDQGGKEVWKYPVSLEERRVPAESRVPADQRLRSVRTQFINRVSLAVLDQLLDKLLEREVITYSEMMSARVKPQFEKAREVVDTAVKYMLSNLTNHNFVNFCNELVHRKGKPQVLRNMVEGKNCSEITEVLLSVFNEKAVEVAAELLNEIKCNKEADQLVSLAVLDQLLDKLLEREVITYSEMMSARVKPQFEKAREVVDTVHRKGAAASRVLINALQEIDPYLYGELDLTEAKPRGECLKAPASFVRCYL